MSKLTLEFDIDFSRAHARATTRERYPIPMHGTVTYSAGSLGGWSLVPVFIVLRINEGMFTRASAVSASSVREMPL